MPALVTFVPSSHRASKTGDRIRITESTFNGFVGTVDRIDATAGLLYAMVQVTAARGPVPVELTFTQIELAHGQRPPAQP
jgi:transcription antitermination factor NusG